jgi:hypothetical protein
MYQLKACKENIIKNSNRNKGITTVSLGSIFQPQSKLVLKSTLNLDCMSLYKITYASRKSFFHKLLSECVCESKSLCKHFQIHE